MGFRLCRVASVVKINWESSEKCCKVIGKVVKMAEKL